MKINYDIAIIGGGASGVLAAIKARELDKDVSICILESMELIGKKLRITGGGRCNFTNNDPIEDFFDKIVTNNKFLYSALYNFTNEDMKKLIRSLGLDYIIEKDNYNKVYLKSGNGQDLIDVLERRLKSDNIDIFYNSKVVDLDIESNPKLVYTDDMMIESEKLIIASGGGSYSQTGSDAYMLDILKNKGIKIIPLKPALTTINIKEGWIKSIPGISLKDVELKYKKNKSKKYSSIIGDIIFTHKGIGGPASLRVSSYINKDISSYDVVLDLIPSISEDELYKICRKDPKKAVSTNLKDIFPQNLLKAIMEEIEKYAIENNIKIDLSSSGNFSKVDFDILLLFTKRISLSIEGLGKMATATVTSGGVAISEISSSTMESKKFKNVYFAGEVIDVDALTGGYNLQIAFSTGVLAGQSCIEK